jgi:hypothetical protein
MFSFTHLYQATADETIVQKVATVLGVTGEEVRETWGRMSTADFGDTRIRQEKARG